MHAWAHQVCALGHQPGNRFAAHQHCSSAELGVVLLPRSLDLLGEAIRLDCTHGMLSRFATKSQLQSFLRLPPCEDVSGQAEGVPLHAVLDFAYSVAPPTGTKNASPQSALL